MKQSQRSEHRMLNSNAYPTFKGAPEIRPFRAPRSVRWGLVVIWASICALAMLATVAMIYAGAQ